MKVWNGYETTKALVSSSEKLPEGGYVLIIKGVEEVQNDWGSSLLFRFDVREGEYEGYYAENYRSQYENPKWKGTYRLPIPIEDGSESDEFRKRRFKGAIQAIEGSNEGYRWDWDEGKLKGKTVGGVFFQKEYFVDGRGGFYTACHHFEPADKIREGRYKIPEPKLLNSKKDAESKAAPLLDADLPF